jgi:hypothetical protein
LAGGFEGIAPQVPQRLKVPKHDRVVFATDSERQLAGGCAGVEQLAQVGRGLEPQFLTQDPAADLVLPNGFARGRGTGACSVGASTLIGYGLFACPSCPVLLLGTLGVAFWATSLPLYGLELKLLALALLAGAFVWMRRREQRLRTAPEAAV